jgi:surfeit locus 1 family protein
VTVTGNLHWPDEVDGFTPEPTSRNIWFARDVAALAQDLGPSPSWSSPATCRFPTPGDALAGDTSGIPNDHLNYAVTWFSLAASGWG